MALWAVAAVTELIHDALSKFLVEECGHPVSLMDGGHDPTFWLKGIIVRLRACESARARVQACMQTQKAILEFVLHEVGLYKLNPVV